MAAPSNSSQNNPSYWSGNVWRVYNEAEKKYVVERELFGWDSTSQRQRPLHGVTGKFLPDEPPSSSSTPSSSTSSSSTSSSSSSRARNKISTMEDLASLTVLPGASKTDYLEILNHYEKRQMTKQDLLRSVTVSGVENKLLLVKWGLSNQAHLDEEEKLQKQMDVLNEEVFEVKQLNIKLRTLLSQSLSRGKSHRAENEKCEAEVSRLSSEVERLESGNLALVGQLAEATAAIKEAEEAKKAAETVETNRMEEEASKLARTEADHKAAEESETFEGSATLSIDEPETLAFDESAEPSALANFDQCHKCDKEFSTKKQFKAHMWMIHNGSKDLKCIHCGMSFMYQSKLDKHLLVHTKKDSFKCDECGKAFGRKDHLKNHQNVHRTKNLFNCEVCNKTFNRKENLTTHLKGHSETFSCTHCTQTFSRTSYLMKHMLRHPVEMLYKCSHCGESFAQRSSLYKHVGSHMEVLP